MPPIFSGQQGLLGLSTVGSPTRKALANKFIRARGSHRQVEAGDLRGNGTEGPHRAGGLEGNQGGPQPALAADLWTLSLLPPARGQKLKSLGLGCFSSEILKAWASFCCPREKGGRCGRAFEEHPTQARSQTMDRKTETRTLAADREEAENSPERHLPHPRRWASPELCDGDHSKHRTGPSQSQAAERPGLGKSRKESERKLKSRHGHTFAGPSVRPWGG